VNPPEGDRGKPSPRKRKVYQADPLTCRKCGAQLKLIAYITDELAIRRILAHLGPSPPQDEKPPPPAPEIVRVPVNELGSGDRGALS
jgi:hypothetical protein